MKLDYSVKYTDKKGSAIYRATTTNGWETFARRTMPNGKPVSWVEYNSGKCMYATWKPYNTDNIVRL